MSRLFQLPMLSQATAICGENKLVQSRYNRYMYKRFACIKSKIKLCNVTIAKVFINWLHEKAEWRWSMSTLLIIIWIVSGFIFLHNIQVQDTVNSR